MLTQQLNNTNYGGTVSHPIYWQQVDDYIIQIQANCKANFVQNVSIFVSV